MARKSQAAPDSAAALKAKEEHKQLLVHHMSKLRGQLAEVNGLREPLKEAQEEFTALVNQAKADLGKGYTRKYLMSLLEDATTRLRDLLKEEERRAVDREALGLPVYGVQADLFDNGQTPTEAKDEMAWEAEGYLRGRNGALEVCPEGTPTRFEAAVLRGYERGQKATQEDFLAAQELIAKRGEPEVGEGVDLNAEPEEDEEEAIDSKVRQLKRSGFTDRSAANAPEAPAAA